MTWGDKGDWIRLAIALIVLAASLLTVFRAPGIWAWKPAILIGEFGHLISILTVAFTLHALFGSSLKSLANLGTLICSLGATALLLKPCIQAANIARTLPETLASDIGSSDALNTAPFSLSSLFKWGQLRTSIDTVTYKKTASGEELKLDFYHPNSTEEKSPPPCIIVVHGGGWNSGSRDELAKLNYYLANLGYAVAAIEYQLAPEAQWPTQRQDLGGAIAYLKANASDLKLDATRFALFGRSAGGQIASAFSATVNDPAVRATICFYSPHDMRFAWEYGRPDDALNSLKLLRQYLGGTPEEQSEAYDSASSVFNLNTPPSRPMLLVHGKLDTLVWVEQSRRMAAKLKTNEIPHFYLELPWATHAFEFNLNGPGGQLATYALESFLKANLHRRPVGDP